MSRTHTAYRQKTNCSMIRNDEVIWISEEAVVSQQRERKASRQQTSRAETWASRNNRNATHSKICIMTHACVGVAAIPTHLVVFMYVSVCIATCIHRSRPQVTAVMNKLRVRDHSSSIRAWTCNQGRKSPHRDI
jgi:hypothetical protein